MKKVKTKFNLRGYLKKVFTEANSFCKTYQHLIQAIGIFVGLYLIFLTYQQLQLAKQQEYQKQLPMWEFDIIDSLSTARLRPFSQDIKLEEATAYLPDKYFGKDNRTFLDQPNFELYLTTFKDTLSKLISANYDNSSLGLRIHFPIGIKISYVQFGEMRTAEAIFAIHFRWWKISDSTTIELHGIKFVKYISSGEKLMTMLNKFSSEDLRKGKYPEVY
jgi:hypothetical protein